MARVTRITCDMCGEDVTGKECARLMVPIIDPYKRLASGTYTSAELDLCEKCLNKVTVVTLPYVGGYEWREE